MLLVDDVLDTGWTMTVAARLLRHAGAAAVLPFVLALDTRDATPVVAHIFWKVLTISTATVATLFQKVAQRRDRSAVIGDRWLSSGEDQ